MNSQYVNGIDFLSGMSQLEVAIRETIAHGIDLNGSRITNLGYPIDNTDGANKQYVLDTFVVQGNAGQLAPLNVIDDALPLSGTLNLVGSHQVLVNNLTGSSAQTQAVNFGSMTSATNSAISTSTASLRLNGIDIDGDINMHGYRINNISDGGERSDVVSKGYIDDSSLNATASAIAASNFYTQTQVVNQITGRFAKLEQSVVSSATYTAVGDNLNLRDTYSSFDPPIEQYRLYGLPHVDLSVDNTRNMSQPLNAKQLQQAFCSTGQKESLIADYE